MSLTVRTDVAPPPWDMADRTFGRPMTEPREYDRQQHELSAEERGDFLQALLYEKSGLYAEAAPLLEAIARRHPNFVPVFFHLGVAVGNLGDNEGAVKAFRRATELNPKDWIARSNLALGLLYLGNERSERRCLERAATEARRALRETKNEPFPHLMLGRALYALGRSEEAREQFAAAARLSGPDRLPSVHADALSMLGQVLLESSSYEEAREALRASAAVNPGHAPTWFALALAASNLGDFAEARDAYLRVVELDPDNVAALTNLGACYVELGDVAAAEALVPKVAERHPQFAAEQYNNLASAFARAGRLDDAVAAYERALAADPSHISSLLNLAVVHMEAGRDADVVGTLERALAAAPGDPQVRALAEVVSQSEIREALIADGLVRDARLEPFEDFEPVEVSGRPLSEILVEDRR